ncbi:hypothetical protein EBB_22090 [Methylomonas sp. EbB]|uniref:Uncharacterized protein n=2 Tax=Methylomonas fluvii TaxID=1854564 RepID=A0ABR9DJ38_9GAMM|nr:hypothetical protein [Methylomonas fluvii]MBD9363124.1 hypothetical protein [Methylomonas fluvii]
MEHIFRLSRPMPAPPKPNNPLLQAGYRYSLDTQKLADNPLSDVEHDLQNGLLGDYPLSIEQGVAIAVDTKQTPIQAFVWNSDLLSTPLKSCLDLDSTHPQYPNQNRLTLIDAGMAAPTVSLADDMPTLSISPHFELAWDTAGFCSQLGILQLLESTRTAHFADGKTMTLLDTETEEGGPVLYLSGKERSAPVIPLGGFQQQGQQQKLLFSQVVTQSIPSEIAGNTVASISVLEKYTVYFMQNAGPDRPDLYIWVPVHLPIVWGWSIRVQQRYDGVWDIFRKKLIMPSASTEAPKLPLWRNNSLACQTTRMA